MIKISFALISGEEKCGTTLEIFRGHNESDFNLPFMLDLLVRKQEIWEVQKDNYLVFSFEA